MLFIYIHFLLIHDFNHFGTMLMCWLLKLFSLLMTSKNLQTLSLAWNFKKSHHWKIWNKHFPYLSDWFFPVSWTFYLCKSELWKVPPSNWLDICAKNGFHIFFVMQIMVNILTLPPNDLFMATITLFSMACLLWPPSGESSS